MSEEKILLRIDADPQVRTSLARGLTDEFIKKRLEEHPGTRVVRRDLASNPVPQIAKDEDVGALYAPAETHSPAMARLAAISDELCQELLDADEVVVATTMYNMTVPAILKSWIDLTMRGRRTFRFSPQGAVGLVKNCRALFVVTKGGIYSRGPQQRDDFLEPYLKAIFGFVGIRDTTFVTAEGLAIDAEIRKEAVAAAKASLNELAATW